MGLLERKKHSYSLVSALGRYSIACFGDNRRTHRCMALFCCHNIPYYNLCDRNDIIGGVVVGIGGGRTVVGLSSGGRL